MTVQFFKLNSHVEYIQASNEHLSEAHLIWLQDTQMEDNDCVNTVQG